MDLGDPSLEPYRATSLVVALAFAEAGAAEALLAVFMTSILVIWAVKLVDHAGLLHGHSAAGVAR